MSDLENANMPQSLADIAGMDVSDVAELRQSLTPAGIFVFEGESGTLGQREKDDAIMYGAQMRFKILEVEAILDRDINPETLVGKTHGEFRNIDPTDPVTGIGYLKGFVADIGLDSKGPMGGIPAEDRPEGYVEGFLDKIVGHRFRAKITQSKDKTGTMRSRMEPIKTKG